MKLHFLTSLLVLGSILVTSCNKESNTQGQNNSQEWLIPSNEVQDGGPGKDGIPSIDNPQFTAVSAVNYLSDNDLVVGIVYDGQAVAYPHPILDWHEIVNDEISDKKIALTYCPLTGTAIAWDRTINGNTTTFGVSGKLYNSNLIPYDRATDSNWSQIGLNCVNGSLINTVAETIPVIETTWETWKTMYPDANILNTNTGFNRNYGQYPYGDYITNHNRLIFPIAPSDNRLPSKERVLGVLTSDVNRVYSINEFENARIIFDTVGDENLIIIGSKADNFMVAFHNPNNNDWTINLTNLPIIATDSAGNQLDVSGQIVAGPMAGSQLDSPTSFIGYWFSFGAFYPDIEIYNN